MAHRAKKRERREKLAENGLGRKNGGFCMIGTHEWTVRRKAKTKKPFKKMFCCSYNVILTCFMMARMKSGSNLRE